MDEVVAIVLAGGRSRRMGRDKAGVVLGGRTLLQRAVDATAGVATRVVIVGAPGRALPEVACARPLVFVTDPVEGEGPLAGIVTGLEAAGAPVAVVTCCDQPFIRPAFLWLLAECARTHVAVLPVFEGRPEPLCTAVRREALPQLRAALDHGNRAAMVLADLPGALLLPREEWEAADPDGWSFTGVNTPEELARAETLLERFAL